MKKLTKVICSIATAAAMCAGTVALSACGDGGGEKYYGKTITLTGAAAPIQWDTKCVRDNGPDNNNWTSLDDPNYDSTDYSLRELLTRYWDRIDFSYGGPESSYGPFGPDVTLNSVDELITYVDSKLGEVYKEYENVSFIFSEKSDNMTLTVKSVYEDEEGEVDEEVMVFAVVESQQQATAAISKVDPRCVTIINYLSDFGMNNPGRDCMGLIDTDEDGLYDSYCNFFNSNYTINGNVRTIGFSMNYLDRENSFNNGANDCYHFSGINEVSDSLVLWGYESNNGRGSILTIPLNPMFNIVDTVNNA